MGYPKKHRGRRKIGSKKEEQEKEIKKIINYNIYERNNSNKKIGFMDFFNSINSNKSLSFNFSKSRIFRWPFF